MDPICEEINNCVKVSDYKKLFNYNDESIQIYFDNLCIQGNIYVADILMKLFPKIKIINALIYTYTCQNQSLFELLCQNITPEIKNECPNLIEQMLLHSYDYYNGEKRYISGKLLTILINQGTFNCDDVFVNAINAGMQSLAEIMIKKVSHDIIVRCFESAYASGNYGVAKLTYNRICIHRIIVNPNLGYCPSGSIIKMIRFQEFYKWEDQISKSAADKNYFAIEALVEKMQLFGKAGQYVLQFSVIESAIGNCTDALLFSILRCFTITGLDKKHIKMYDRLPLWDYYENKILNSSWVLVHANSSNSATIEKPKL